MEVLNLSHSAILVSSHVLSCELTLPIAGKATSHPKHQWQAACTVCTCSLVLNAPNTPSLLTGLG